MHTLAIIICMMFNTCDKPMSMNEPTPGEIQCEKGLVKVVPNPGYTYNEAMDWFRKLNIEIECREDDI